MFLAARPHEDEVVRFEQRTEISVGQQPRVRAVAGALEAVELDRAERIDGRELIDHEYPSSRTRHACHLRQHELRPRDVMENGALAYEVELPDAERHPRRVALDELDVRILVQQ